MDRLQIEAFEAGLIHASATTTRDELKRLIALLDEYASDTVNDKAPNLERMQVMIGDLDALAAYLRD